MSKARETTQDGGADTTAPVDDKPDVAAAEPTPRVAHDVAMKTREIQQIDAQNQLQQQRLRDAELGEPIALGTGAAAPRPAADAPQIAAQNRSPSLDQVASDTHVMMRGHRDVAPGGAVQTSQDILNRVGAEPALEPDGIYGPKTETAVREFQRAHGLEEDGLLGDETLAAMEARDAEVMRDEITQSGLPPEQQQQFLDRMDAAQTAADQREVFAEVQAQRAGAGDQRVEQVEDAGEQPVEEVEEDRLSPEVRAQVDGAIAKHAGDPSAQGTLTDLSRSEGFAELSPEEQGRMLDYVGADTQFLADDARGLLGAQLQTPEFRNATAAEQAQQLRTFMQEQPGLPFVNTYPAGHMDGRRRDYTISDPVEIEGHPFRGAEEAALRYDVTVGEHTVPVYVAANQDPSNGHFHSIDEIARGLAAMPDVALGEVGDVTINPVRNPEDDHWAEEFGDPDFRSYMTAGAGGHITVYPTQWQIDQSEVDSAMMHEVGHATSHGLWGWDETQPSWQEYRDAIAADGIDVSQYAQYNADEDFSETFSLYMGVRGTAEEAEVRAMYPNRFRMFDSIVQGER